MGDEWEADEYDEWMAEGFSVAEARAWMAEGFSVGAATWWRTAGEWAHNPQVVRDAVITLRERYPGGYDTEGRPVRVNRLGAM